MNTGKRKTKKMTIGMKRVCSVIAAFFLCVGMMAGCGGQKEGTLVGNTEAIEGMVKRDFNPDLKSIVCTTFPQYDWMRNILGEHEAEFNLLLLLDNGMDLHSYQPTAEDISRIAACDLFVYVGGMSDSWVEDALKEATNSDMQVVNLMSALGTSVKQEETVEGMQQEEEDAGEAAQGTPEYDEHVWLSLKNAESYTAVLVDAMTKVDEANSADYKTNGDAYIAKLAALDEKYEKAVSGAQMKTVLFGDRFPFRYLVDDYNLDYYAAFVGCSAETEASFETIAFLAGKVDELGLSYIFALEGSDQKLAQAIIGSAKNRSCEIISVNSLQSVTNKDIAAGATYLSVMEDNLSAFEKALSKE